MDYVGKLKEFQQALYDRTKNNEVKPNTEWTWGAIILRMNLIQEEFDELYMELEGSCDKVEDINREAVRKELCDLLYVTFATAVVLGLPVEQDFELVHQNNMLKIATGTIREDGKLVKPKDHPKVELPL